MERPPIRWHAVATYRSEAGPVDVEHEVSELIDLARLIELGPDWSCIEGIRIVFIGPCREEGLTVEEAARR